MSSVLGLARRWPPCRSDLPPGGAYGSAIAIQPDFLAQFLAIGLAMLVSIPLIATHDELTGAFAPLSVSLVIGAFVFGAAMQVADGCGSGTLYKAGLGNGFPLAVLPGFIAGSFLETAASGSLARARQLAACVAARTVGCRRRPGHSSSACWA